MIKHIIVVCCYGEMLVNVVLCVCVCGVCVWCVCVVCVCGLLIRSKLFTPAIPVCGALVRNK